MRMRTGFVVLGVVLAISAVASAAPIVWTGPKITFTKANFADWTLPANQDRLTDSTWLTRANTGAIFNIKSESGYDSSPASLSPLNVEWAYGHAVDHASLTFDNSLLWLGGTSYSIPGKLVNENITLHLISDDIYLDFKVTSWTAGIGNVSQGGGVTWERSTPAAIPEPVTMTLLGLGLGGIAWLRRRKA